MNSSRRRGFVLGVAVFFIAAAGTYAALDGLFIFILFDVSGLEIGSDGFTTLVLAGSAVFLILTIAVPIFVTRVVVRKWS